MVRHRARIRFRKEGDLRLTGHHDLMRLWERLFRRAGIKLRMSEGFHKRPKLNLPSALALGVAGIDEVLEVEFEANDEANPPLAAELLTTCQRHAPPGLGIDSLVLLDPALPLAELSRVTYELAVPPQRRESVAARVSELLALKSYLLDRGPERKPLDVRPLIDDATWSGDALQVRVWVPREGSVRPRDLIAIFGLDPDETTEAALTRTSVELRA